MLLQHKLLEPVFALLLALPSKEPVDELVQFPAVTSPRDFKARGCKLAGNIEDGSEKMGRTKLQIAFATGSYFFGQRSREFFCEADLRGSFCGSELGEQQLNVVIPVISSEVNLLLL